METDKRGTYILYITVERKAGKYREAGSTGRERQERM